MTTVGEEEVDYESDPEEAKRSLAMRRREASDDEEGEREGREKSKVDRRVGIHSDESDGQGGAADYEDDEELGIEDEEEEVEEEVDDEEVEEGDEEEEEAYDESGREAEAALGPIGVESSGVAVHKEGGGDERRSVEESVDANVGAQGKEEEDKKENEPFAVPTAGAFYMHDDRFRDSAGGRHRRTHGGRKLWESKDDRKWGHDKFEEITFQERHYEEGRRSSKGHYRGRGRNRIDRGYGRGNRSKVYNNNNNNINQSQAPKGVRGKGPRRYEPAMKNSSQTSSAQNRQSGKSLEKPSHANSGRGFTPVSNSESNPAPTRKNVFASSLNSASPPFYPSGSSTKDITLTHKRDVQAASTNKNARQSVMDESFSVPQTNALVRGKNIAESVNMDKLHIDDSVNSAAGKTLNNLQMPPSGPSLVNTSQPPQSRAQGRVVLPGQMSYQPAPPHNQLTRASSSTQLHAVQRSPAQNRAQPAVQNSTQQLGQRPGSGSQTSSPPKTAVSLSSLEPGEVESPLETSKSKTALVGKGKGIAQGSGRGSHIYGGAQVIAATGSMGVSHGDQNFPGTPAFLPVMQFGGQHPGGIGVPAVGMAFPGYVANPQLGLGNSEMTWLPVLAGAGALGSTYCPPYIAVDGNYHPRPSGQTSSGGTPSKENNANKPNNEWKSSQKSEIVNDEFGQRQNKPRRYSEMNFGQ
ncbi:protein MLN51 homolog [Ziziphus jujuba]|uniref:Protein MLN51 homolog n=1 Tax=Ziziphus jujuba TaxID=326968 RepID=A0ABM3I2D4_ZIZJJ|nr:protein MLN51 homolog [Ziziphus jujuba]XP_048319180.2 protein MLN51 homolog [Ziziphus jujuba]XP_048319185.2 protein MLN51 homolog [Ziziphus jujuba]XP_048319189.2 protein MLN51 homolog [Ziziphus jujuba]